MVCLGELPQIFDLFLPLCKNITHILHNEYVWMNLYPNKKRYWYKCIHSLFFNQTRCGLFTKASFFVHKNLRLSRRPLPVLFIKPGTGYNHCLQLLNITLHLCLLCCCGWSLMSTVVALCPSTLLSIPFQNLQYYCKKGQVEEWYCSVSNPLPMFECRGPWNQSSASEAL